MKHMLSGKTWRLAVAATLAGSLALTACSGEADDASADRSPAEEPSLEFTGPNGETPESLDQLELTDEEVAQVKAGNYTAAFVWHESSALVGATEKGAREEFERLGIEVVASTEAGFDPARQADNLQSVLALDPDIIVTIAVDPTSAAAAFQPAVDAGVKLAVMTTPPAGYESGDEIVSIVTGALTEYGKANAEMLGEAIGGEGEVGYLYHDADFWFTNQRDQAFKDWTAHLYPDIEIVAEEGFSDPARTEDIANAMITRNPEIKGIYVAWATAAEGVLAALRQAGRSDVKVVTNDLEANLASDMMRDGNVVGIVGNSSVGLGRGLAIVGAYGVLGKQAPELVANPPFAVTKDNIVEGWESDYAEEPPSGVLP
ncbi:substrate-binding domain-containing protein [Blastococcus sp. PRF04-17]|uniref:substrate-binding domain-containing protein n=1 Tax=Blastococcus sp. PRF04-17 TaxID=2933797 RepID=UPI001FF22076|nr:substrate-binding domain-containing protein [Blastococcus sp. PRF04-17]UOY02862.1 substrate-binding domain-containing protein [Blastococcus sp. PRF04-17]